MRKYVGILVVGILSVNGWCEVDEKYQSTNTISTSDTTSFEKSFEISAGYIANDWKNSDNDKVDAKGVGVSAGKIFNLSHNFSTTTSIIANFISLDKKDIEYNRDDTARRRDFGLAQKISYNINNKDFVLRPFLEIGVSKGKLKLQNDYEEDGEYSNFDVDLDYKQYGSTFGLQFVMKNGIAPYVSYNISKVKVDLPWTDEVTDSNEQKFDSRSFVVGLGYLF